MMEPIRTQDAGPWLPPESAQPLVAWSAPQLEALGAALQRAVAQWREAWGLPAATGAARCAAAEPETVLREGWRMLGDSSAAAWLHVPAESAGALAQFLFGAETQAPVATGVAEACTRDGQRRLCALLGLPDADALPQSPPPGVGQPWSGAVQATLEATPGWTLLISAEAMHAWCRRNGVPTQAGDPARAREPLCSATDAMGSRTVPVHVELAGCEIDLGALQGLQIGDVVRLPHAVDAPARLTDSHGQLLFEGYLVAHQGRKAIELAQRNTH